MTEKTNRHFTLAALQVFAAGLLALDQYVARTGHADVPINHVEGKHKLGRWVAHQRIKYRKGTLPAEHIKNLERYPGWLWHAWDRGWAQGISALKAFVLNNGHARVPQNTMALQFPLGRWLLQQRKRLRRGMLAEQRRQELLSLPGVTENWRQTKATLSWDRAFTQLKAFIAEHGHSNVPRNYRAPAAEELAPGPCLGTWCCRIRAERNRGALSDERISALEALEGWHWAVPRNS